MKIIGSLYFPELINSDSRNSPFVKMTCSAEVSTRNSSAIAMLSLNLFFSFIIFGEKIASFSFTSLSISP